MHRYGKGTDFESFSLLLRRAHFLQKSATSARVAGQRRDKCALTKARPTSFPRLISPIQSLPAKAQRQLDSATTTKGEKGALERGSAEELGEHLAGVRHGLPGTSDGLVLALLVVHRSKVVVRQHRVPGPTASAPLCPSGLPKRQATTRRLGLTPRRSPGILRQRSGRRGCDPGAT